MQTVFITGTDTGVGKTVVASQLVNYWVAQGLKVSGYKPVASGAETIDKQLQNEDAQALLAASNTQLPYSLINPYCFEPATAPHIAAEQVSNVVDLAVLNQCYRDIKAQSEKVVIEGAGGWQVPLNSEATFADWVAQHQWPVILVVNIKLGCINHAILTSRDIVSYQCPFAGWVANLIDSDVPFQQEMITTLKRMIPAPMLGVMPTLSPETQNSAVELDFQSLGGPL